MGGGVMIRVRVIADHLAGAWGDWEFHEWVFTGKVVRADRTGRRNPHMVSAKWWEVRCNNPHCSALAIVNKEDVLGLLPPAPQSKPLGVAP